MLFRSRIAAWKVFSQDVVFDSYGVLLTLLFLPSERAFAYKMKLDAIKNQGARSDLTSTQVAQKLSVEKVGDDAGVSKDTIRRFIRLTNLVPELLDMDP